MNQGSIFRLSKSQNIQISLERYASFVSMVVFKYQANCVNDRQVRCRLKSFLNLTFHLLQPTMILTQL